MTEKRESVVVEACARLHFGLLQTAAGRSRRFGGVGLFLRNPGWKLAFTECADMRLVGEPLAVELSKVAVSLIQNWQSRHRRGVELCVNSAIPLHVGLGSKTSFVQALSAGLAAIAGGEKEARALLLHSGRGRTSGIGSSALLGGGFTLDAGVRSAGAWLPSSRATWYELSATAAKFRFPECEILLAREKEAIGLSGSAEQALFRQNLPSSEVEIDQLAAVVLFDLIPSIVSEDLAGIVEAIQRMQDLGFKRTEWSIQSQNLRDLRTLTVSMGCACALSSMGPTVAIFSKSSSASLAGAIRNQFGDAFELQEARPMNDVPVRVLAESAL